MLPTAGIGSIRQLDKVGKLWAEMHVAGSTLRLSPTGLFRRSDTADRAVSVLNEMREERIEANLITCNPIMQPSPTLVDFSMHTNWSGKFPLNSGRGRT